MSDTTRNIGSNNFNLLAVEKEEADTKMVEEVVDLGIAAITKTLSELKIYTKQISNKVNKATSYRTKTYKTNY